MHYLFLISLLLLSPTVAISDNQLPTGTRINISVVAETELANDEVITTFRIEKEGKHAGKVRNYVNKVTSQIKALLEKEKGLKHKTISRNMQPVWHYPHGQPRVRTSWKMTQIEQVISTDLDAVAGWLDAIENKGAHLNNLQFRISKQVTKKAIAQLRIQAIRSFREEAKLLTKSISGKSFRILQLNSNSHNPQPRRHMEMSMMSHSKAQAAPPRLSSGEGSLRVTVNGEIEVPFRDFQVK